MFGGFGVGTEGLSNLDSGIGLRIKIQGHANRIISMHRFPGITYLSRGQKHLQEYLT